MKQQILAISGFAVFACLSILLTFSLKGMFVLIIIVLLRNTDQPVLSGLAVFPAFLSHNVIAVLI